jgi:hypothetical protein
VTEAGYSGTPLPEKLGIKPGHRVLVLGGAPDGFLAEVEDAVVVHRTTKQPANVIVLFVRSQAELVDRLPGARSAMVVDGGLWVAWPKKASGVVTDITEDVVREIALPSGMVDTKVAAIDDTWSGLKLVLRKEMRPGRRTAG